MVSKHEARPSSPPARPRAASQLALPYGQRSTNAISDTEFERAIEVEQGKLVKLSKETQERLGAGR